MTNSDETKVLTENPLLDEIIWNAKMLARGVVLKDQDEADKYETLETIQNGDMLIAVNQYNVRFDRFLYTETLLRKMSNISEERIYEWSRDNSKIPVDFQPALLNLAVNEFKNNYIEKNNYFRRLHGEPNYDENGEWKGLWIDVNTISETNKYPSISSFYKSDSGTDYKLIHQLSLGYIELLYEVGVIDLFIDGGSYSDMGLIKTDVLYLLHMGSRSIPYYNARKGERFEMLYCPTSDAVEVESRFKELLEANRLTTLYTIYSDAYKFQSEYYDRFIMIMIIVQTVVDMMVELPEYLIRRDVFDDRTCQYIFESNGVDYFKDIPIKFQVALVKNLNKLLKFKSTDKCMIDICSIFGCKSIEIFKYYILKDRKIMSESDIRYYNIENDNVSNYDIKFLKVPILDTYDNYIRSGKNIYDYDTMIDGDDYWNGDKQRDDVLKEIKNMDFTLLRSKYYSVEAMIDITNRTFDLVYFMNILMYNEVDKEKLVVSLPNVSTKKTFEIVDVVLTLYALSYIYYGIEDEIMDTQKKVLQVLGFNFEADLTVIGEHLYETYGLTLKDLKVDGFQIPDDTKILTFAQLENLYTTNKNVYDHVREQLMHPRKKEVYDAYKYIFDSLFIMRLNMDYFSLPDGTLAGTYTEFLEHKDPLLSAFLTGIKTIQDVEKRQSQCINSIQAITTYLKDYVDQDIINMDNVFAGLPSISLDFVKKYVQEVIDFFKSFKIFTHDMSLTYLFDDKYQNTIRMIDWILLKYFFEKAEVVKIEDWISRNFVSLSKNEKIDLIDKVWLDIDTWINKEFGDYYNNGTYSDKTNIMRDLLNKHIATFDIHEQGFEESILDEMYRMIVSVVLSSTCHIDDKMVEKIFTMDKEEFFSEQIQDLIYKNLVSVEYHQGFKLKEKKSGTNHLNLRTVRSSLLSDHPNQTNIHMQHDEKYNIVDNYYLIITSER